MEDNQTQPDYIKESDTAPDLLENSIPSDTHSQTECDCSCEHIVKKSFSFQCVMNILTLVLFVSTIVLFILYFNSKESSKKNPNATPAVVAKNGALKIAYIDTDTLMANYKYALELQKELETFQRNKEAEYKSKMAQFQNDYQKYLKDGPNMTRTQQKAKETELQQRSEKLQSLEGDYAMQIQKKTLQESEKMTRAVYAYIREYNAANQQFDLILAKSFANSPLLYGNEKMDITKEILEGLNKEHESLKDK